MEVVETSFVSTLEAAYQDPELWNRIQAIDLSLIAARMRGKHEWLPEKVDQAIAEYRQFLFMTQKNEQLIAPNSAADAIWHEHILHTEQYANDCNAMFGKFLHHKPAKWGCAGVCNEGMRNGKDANVVDQDDVAQKFFKINLN